MVKVDPEVTNVCGDRYRDRLGGISATCILDAPSVRSGRRRTHVGPHWGPDSTGNYRQWPRQ